MKIEKTHENQIRCTIEADELADRHLRLNDLTYGSPQAQRLFEEVMQQAAEEYGFTAGDIPLMVEAVPLEGEKLLFIITKVDYPEELDTRFSRFTAAEPSDVIDAASLLKEASKLFSGLEEPESVAKPEVSEAESKGPDPFGRIRIYSFEDMEKLIALAKLLPDEAVEESSLYRSPQGQYIFMFSKSENWDSNTIMNIVSEFGSKLPRGMGSDLYVREHYRLLIEKDALSALKNI